MGLLSMFRRRGVKATSAAGAPGAGQSATFPLSDPNAWASLFGPPATVSAEVAMTHGAVYRCVFLIAGTISMLRLASYAAAGTPDELEETGSPQARLLGERPNPRYSRVGFWRSVVSDMLLKGNAIVWIERAKSGTPLALWWIPWGRTGVHFAGMPDGSTALVYSLTLDDGRLVTAHQDDVMHFGGTPIWNLMFYVSPISAYGLSSGIGLSADRFAKAYFDNGGSSDLAISFGQPLTDEQAAARRKRFAEVHGGGNRFNGPLFLDASAKVEQLKITAQDAQILEARRYQTNDIGMIFGVPSHLLNQTDKATSFGKGLEELSQSFIDFTLGPHLAMIEDEINWKLYGQRTKAARFDRDSFIRGDLKSRAEALQVLLGGAQGPGTISQNEARSRIGLPRKRDAEHDVILGWGAPPPAAKPAAKLATPPTNKKA